ncbi:Zinc finger protein ZAT9 [Platanthera zijinensis]|uniref:Zinc finger protein ZAT9 n=1 Tax=Platanthera zijinensis TaxID=2320716 RepID=A0AAP0C2K4_9ASPA
MEKHACRICSKSFPTGRSLGGHMRSHICSYAAEVGKKKKLSGQVGGCSTAGYVLREKNPKKLWRVSDLADEDPTSSSSSLKWKQCRECGKVFPSSKALFGHLRCHSSKVSRRVCRTELKQEQGQGEEEEEGSWSGQKFSQESISENNAPPAESGLNRRSNLASAVIQVVAAAAAASSSITAYEQEQEEVAISLMMLSRDSDGCWAESSDKQSMVFEEDEPRSEQGDFDCECLEEADNSGDEPKRKKTLINLAEIGKKTASVEEKGRFFHAYESPKWGKTEPKLEAHINAHPAAGASIPIKLSAATAPATRESKPAAYRNPVPVSTKLMNPTICDKIFSSGQALGGHKRSHIAPNTDAGIHSDNNTAAAAAAAAAVIVPELLDLNFPAPVEEEFSNVKPWRQLATASAMSISIL